MHFQDIAPKYGPLITIHASLSELHTTQAHAIDIARTLIDYLTRFNSSAIISVPFDKGSINLAAYDVAAITSQQKKIEDFVDYNTAHTRLKGNRVRF